MNKGSFDKTIVLLDSHAILHRAYHAMPDFKTRDGVPTGALYGFLSMVLGIIDVWKPYTIAACFDLPKPTFRHEAYDAYKGTRKKTDEDLITQIKTARIVCERLGIPVYDAEGFEADDVLGTIAHQLQNESLQTQVVIATGDMDTLQLVKGNQVVVFMPKKGIKETITYNEEKVIERFTFGPELVADYKGLRGDPSDNIPGVPKVGDKTATGLINAFGTVAHIYEAVHAENAEELFVEKGLRKSLIPRLVDHEDDAFFSKTLATIRLDAPVTYTVPDQSWKDTLEFETIAAICNEYSFKSLVGKFEQVLNGLRQGGDIGESAGGAAKSVAQAQNPTAPPDTQTPGDSQKKGGLQNSVWLEELSEDKLRELQIMVWLLNPESLHPSIEVIAKELPAGVESFASAQEALQNMLEEKELQDVWKTVEQPLIKVIKTMQENGVLIDTEIIKTFEEKSKALLQNIETKIREYAGEEMNLRSTQQLSKLLFETLGLSTKGVKKTKHGTYSTKEDVLVNLKNDHEVVHLILKHRELSKFLSTYVVGFQNHIQENGRIHAEFWQDGAATGRFSSHNPNMQNLPNGLVEEMNFRNIFIAPTNTIIVAADYSQVELRIAAMMAQDDLLLDAFESNKDIHTLVASRMFEKAEDDISKQERRAAKAVNFGMLYGMGPRALGKNLDIPFSEAKTFHAKHKAEFPRVHAWLQEVVFKAGNNGYTSTWWGRKRWINGIHSENMRTQAHAQRTALNAPVQGTAADVIKLAMVNVQQSIKSQNLEESVKMTMQVHDEIVFEVSKSALQQAVLLIKTTMENVVNHIPNPPKRMISLKVDVEVGDRYGELKQLDK